MIVKIVRMQEDVIVPEYKTLDSSGMDIRSLESLTIPPLSTRTVRTGVRLKIPRGYECQVRSRSGLASNKGVVVANSPGTIDSDYTGEVYVILYNNNPIDSVYILSKERIAQLVFASTTKVVFEEVEELDRTTRGCKGLGSTGRL